MSDSRPPHLFNLPILLYESLRRGGLLGRALLVGIALDLVAIATGAWLWERGLRKDSERLVGWGRSFMLQGLVLLGFDSTVFLLNAHYEGRRRARPARALLRARAGRAGLWRPRPSRARRPTGR